MGWKPNHGRVKPKYNPQPNAEEARHEARLREMPCIGCGRFGVDLHHTMIEFPEKRWRRDHRYQLPVCRDCHQGPQGIHGIGSEAVWAETLGLRCTGEIARDLWALSEDAERKAA
jgi:hypothetical protein